MHVCINVCCTCTHTCVRVHVDIPYSWKYMCGWGFNIVELAISRVPVYKKGDSLHEGTVNLGNLHYGFIIVPPASNYIHHSTVCNYIQTVLCAYLFTTEKVLSSHK